MDVNYLLLLGFEEGPDTCFTLKHNELENFLQVWIWSDKLEWFIFGNSLNDCGPKNCEELQQLINILYN